MQLLIFDAKVTNTSYRTWAFESESERQLIERFNATLRFVATNSGLTRFVIHFSAETILKSLTDHATQVAIHFR